MDFFSILTMLGGLALFLYGMQVMGDGLAKISGGKLEKILENLTSSKLRAVLLDIPCNSKKPMDARKVCHNNKRGVLGC